MQLGVLAFGDSITNGGGELQDGVALQSWALWVARGLGVPYSGYAVDGARAHDVVGEQIPAFLARAADPEGPYTLGCLYVGVNDVRHAGWDAAAFADDQAAALRFLAARCERVLAVTLPSRLGRPATPVHRIDAANAAIRSAAVACDGRVLDLCEFGARNRVMADRVHPTALGQVAIAEAALDVLAADGAAVRVRPRALVRPGETDRLGRLRGDLRWVRRALRSQIGRC